MLWPLIGDVQRTAPVGCYNVYVTDLSVDRDCVV